MKFSVLFLFFSTVGLAVERPNVLFIAVDDLRPDLACYGNEQIVSPHIDRLAERGTLFERAYCQQAVCSPSRVSLMTGLRPDTTQVMNLETDFRDTIPEAVTLSQFFISKGYYAASIGKIYHGNMLDEEFSWSVPHVRGNAPTYANKASNDIVRRLREKAVAEGLKGAALRKASLGPAFEAGEVEDEFYRDGANALEAVKRLERLAESGEPFFLAFGLSKPHLPFVSPKRYWDLYDREKLQEPVSARAPKGSHSYTLTNWGELRSYAGMPKSGRVDPADAKSLKHGYYAAVSYIDAQIGRVLAALDDTGLAENTIVVLWSDHGWKLGDYGAWCKHTNVELDVRVPLIVSDPRMKKGGQRSDALVELVDVYATLIDLAGFEVDEALEGKSLKPLLKNPKAPFKKAVFSQYPRGRGVLGISMRTDRYRYTVWEGSGNGGEDLFEIYDHRQDPWELENLAGKVSAEEMAELTKLYEGGWEAQN